MKNVSFLFLLMCFFFAGLFGVPGVRAESLVGDDLTKEGIQYYEKGEFMPAIHTLSKALLADPKNEQAKAYLKKNGN